MTATLPSQRDFDPSGCDLDAQAAWRHFGGLALEAAHRKFRENPFHYQEAFMFMGGKAFAFYFPVIDAFLREMPVPDWDDREAYILAHGIMQQFHPDSAGLTYVRHLAPHILELADHILANIQAFAPYYPEEQRRIESAWEIVKEDITRFANS